MRTREKERQFMRSLWRFAMLTALLCALAATAFAGDLSEEDAASATPLTLNTAAMATISEGNGYQIFSFTPETDGKYVFTSQYGGGNGY